MANVNNTQDTLLLTQASEASPVLLSENDLETMAAGGEGDETVPWCGIKPSRRATTQKIVDSVLASGGTVISVDYDTGKMSYTLGSATPAPPLPRD
nr:hypothetical protein [uncultured Noviherbaspirillum sp.]